MLQFPVLLQPYRFLNCSRFKVHFVEDSVFLDPRATTARPSTSWCIYWYRFCFTVALVAALFAGGLSCFAALQQCRSELSWLGYEAEGRPPWRAVPAVTLGSIVGWEPNSFLSSHSFYQAIRRSYTLQILASRREKRWSCVYRVVSVFFVQFILCY